MAKLSIDTRGSADLAAGPDLVPFTSLAATRPARIELEEPDLFDLNAVDIPIVRITISLPGETSLIAEVPAQAVTDLLNTAAEHARR